MLLCAEPPAIVSESWIDVDVDPPFPFSLLPDRVLQAVGNAALHASLSTLQARHIASALCMRAPPLHAPLKARALPGCTDSTSLCPPAQRVFIRSLAKDYAKWATDASYRQQRIAFAAESDELIRRGQPADAVAVM